VFQHSSWKLSWVPIAASGLVLLLLLLGVSVLAAYLPAARQITRLETELRQVYAHEAELQTELDYQQRRHTVRDQQIAALTAERAALSRRLEELERTLAATQRSGRGRR